MLLSSPQLNKHLYEVKLPQVYRDYDANVGLALKRYLEALVDGGFSKVLNDINDFLELLSPDKCPEEFLPYLCRSFGLEYFEDIDSSYQRKLLMNIGEVIRRRGTYSCIRYLTKVLTDLDVDLSYTRGYNDEEEYGRRLKVVLQSRSMEQILNLDNDIKVLERYLSTQVPYYIDVVIEAKIETQRVQTNFYRTSVISQGNVTMLTPHILL